ncbi:hypothetical protein GFB49_11625 [Epibacterium sp. SM1979]|uniref:Uncharacterized protein n=1 Tax=Tritonibacter litoralis TaxID=2662264 RepID=A0A843YDI4_9RHOB|nr:hypothetical protein [Tritonibacter litoralis]MQQ09106.1 hypothetical protein [Tritonibacter litoralis]
MTNPKSTNPIANGRVKIEGAIYNKGDEIPAGRVAAERLSRLIDKGLVGYPGQDVQSAKGSGAETAAAAPKAVETPAPENRAEGKSGRPDLKVPEGKTEA